MSVVNYNINSYDGDAVIFLASEREQVDNLDLADKTDFTGGWSKYITGNVKAIQVAGHHFNLMVDDQLVKNVAHYLNQCIVEIDGR
ncbi:MAG: hypothetical protein HC921_16375 [Synechococcaceae cyanobacterium SM2_3_1]|nr:hypothetical protein [Synechococcaceae cyanobacterium SM2_3_1]